MWAAWLGLGLFVGAVIGLGVGGVCAAARAAEDEAARRDEEYRSGWSTGYALGEQRGRQARVQSIVASRWN